MDRKAKAQTGLSGVLLMIALALAPAGLLAGDGSYLSISKADCAWLAKHYPADDVTYQPGRDVHGKPVTPADLDGGNGLVLPEAVIIPIEIDLLERFGIPANGANFKGDIFIGEVVVDVASGRATFNGQPLQSETEAELAGRCQQIIRDGAAAR